MGFSDELDLKRECMYIVLDFRVGDWIFSQKMVLKLGGLMI